MTTPARRITDYRQPIDIGWLLTTALNVAAWLLIATAAGWLK